MSDWSLVAVGKDEPTSFNTTRSLTPDEVAEYRKHCDFLQGVLAGRMPFRNMLQAHAQFLHHVQNLESNAATLVGRPIGEWSAPLNHRLDAVLIAMRGYLDQTRFRLKRAGAEGAAALKLFDSSRRARHTASAGYRVMYAMRDYVQHVRPALTGSEVKSTLDLATNTPRYEFTLACGRDDLLAHGFDWKRARVDLEGLPVKFDPRPTLREAIGELGQLDYELFEFQLKRMNEAKAWILALLAQADSSGDPERGTVAKMEDAGKHRDTGRAMWTMRLWEPPQEISWP